MWLCAGVKPFGEGRVNRLTGKIEQTYIYGFPGVGADDQWFCLDCPGFNFMYVRCQPAMLFHFLSQYKDVSPGVYLAVVVPAVCDSRLNKGNVKCSDGLSFHSFTIFDPQCIHNQYMRGGGSGE